MKPFFTRFIVPDVSVGVNTTYQSGYYEPEGPKASMTPLMFRTLDGGIIDRCSSALIIENDTLHFITRIFPKYTHTSMRGNFSRRSYSVNCDTEDCNQIESTHNMYTVVNKNVARFFLIQRYVVCFDKLYLDKITEVSYDPYEALSPINTAMVLDNITATHHRLCELSSRDSNMRRVFKSSHNDFHQCALVEIFKRGSYEY